MKTLKEKANETYALIQRRKQEKLRGELEAKSFAIENMYRVSKRNGWKRER